jgi:hypothetical protein
MDLSTHKSKFAEIRTNTGIFFKRLKCFPYTDLVLLKISAGVSFANCIFYQINNISDSQLFLEVGTMMVDGAQTDI